MNCKEDMEKDLDVFYEDGIFSMPAYYNNKKILIIFEEGYSIIDKFKEKVIKIRRKEVSNLKEGQTITIKHINYKVMSYEENEYDLELSVLVKR